MKQLTADERQVLHAVFSLAMPTRRAILDLTGSSSGRVTASLRSLSQQRLISSRDEPRQGQGRPSAVYGVDPDAFFGVGVALKTGVAVVEAVSGTGEVIERRRIPTEPRAFSEQEVRALLATVRKAVVETISRRDPARCAAVGLSVVGRVDTERGIWLSGFQYGPFRNINVGEVFGDMGVTIVVEDQARATAFRELRRADAKRGDAFAVLTVGNGLGSALVLDGEIHRGAHGVAGEIGHIALAGNERRCVCGDTGCLETVASVSGILATAKARMAEGVISILDGALSLDKISSAAFAHDRLAEQVLQEAGTALGEACAILMKIVNVPRILVCGEGTRLHEHLREPMNRRIRKSAPLESQVDFEVDFVPHSEDDESIGAALLAMDMALGRGK